MQSIANIIYKNVEKLINEINKIIENTREEINQNGKTKTKQTQIKNLSNNKRRRFKQS